MRGFVGHWVTRPGLVISVGTIAAVVFVVGGRDASAGSGATAAFAEARLTTLSTPGVLHAQADHVWLDPQGREKLRRQTEFWFDPGTDRARLDQKGPTATTDVTLVRDGLTVSRLFPQQRYAVLQIASDVSAEYLNAVRDQVLGHKSRLDAGQVEVLNEDEPLAGRSTTKLRGQADLDGGVNTLEVNLDKQTGLPLREVGIDRDTSGQARLVETHLVKYGRVEHLAPAELPRDLFATGVPTGWTYSAYRSLTPTSARSFRAFDMYWLGPSFEGLPLFGVSNDEAQRASGHINSVSVVYAFRPGPGHHSTGQVSLIERPGPTTTEIPFPRAPAAKVVASEPISVAGHAGTLFRGAGGAVRIEVTIGGTFITIHGTDDAQVIHAAGSLQKLN